MTTASHFCHVGMSDNASDVLGDDVEGVDCDDVSGKRLHRFLRRRSTARGRVWVVLSVVNS